VRADAIAARPSMKDMNRAHSAAEKEPTPFLPWWSGVESRRIGPSPANYFRLANALVVVDGRRSNK
jgi:hypothetical protein